MNTVFGSIRISLDIRTHYSLFLDRLRGTLRTLGNIINGSMADINTVFKIVQHVHRIVKMFHDIVRDQNHLLIAFFLNLRCFFDLFHILFIKPDQKFCHADGSVGNQTEDKYRKHILPRTRRIGQSKLDHQTEQVYTDHHDISANHQAIIQIRKRSE